MSTYKYKRKFICENCGDVIESYHKRKYCDSEECRKLAVMNRERAAKIKKNGASIICFDCVNWDTCGKKGSNVRLPFMTRARMVRFKNNNKVIDNYILRVDECEKYKPAKEETKEERVERRKKLLKGEDYGL